MVTDPEAWTSFSTGALFDPQPDSTVAIDTERSKQAHKRKDIAKLTLFKITKSSPLKPNAVSDFSVTQNSRVLSAWIKWGWEGVAIRG